MSILFLSAEPFGALEKMRGPSSSHQQDLQLRGAKPGFPVSGGQHRGRGPAEQGR